MILRPAFPIFLALSLVLPASLLAQAPNGATRNQASGSRFEEWDRNRDGKLTKEELPPPLRRNFDRVDKDGDGFISRAEDADFRNRRPGGRPSPRIPEGVRKIENLAYAGTDNPKQMLDLYLPEDENSEPLPVVCWIHGGGWRSGDKASGGGRVSTLVKSGHYAGVSIGYRLTGEAGWPAQIHDCKAAIRWIRAHAVEYGLDPERIAVWGSSAGGHLVAMLGVSQGVPELEGELGEHLDQSSEVACVVNFYGPSELLTMNEQGSTMDHDAANSPESLLVGGPLQENPETAGEASPISHVSPDDEPMLLVHGTEDGLVPYEQSVKLEAALESEGVPATLVTVEGGGHGRGFGPKIQSLVEDFLAQQLLGNEGSIPDQSIPSEAPNR